MSPFPPVEQGPTSAEFLCTQKGFHVGPSEVETWWPRLPCPGSTRAGLVAQEPSSLARTWHLVRVKSHGGGGEKVFF